MKKLMLSLTMLACTTISSYAQQPNESDFKLIGPADVPVVKQMRSRDDVLADIQKSLDNIDRKLDAMNGKQGVRPPTVTEGNPIVTPPLTVNPPPRAVPPTDGGPAWNYDPATNSYFRYVPNTYQQPRTTTVPYQTNPAPVYYTNPPVYTTPTIRYSSPPVVMDGGNCPT